MPKLSDLLAEKAKGEVVVGGATVTFTFWALWRQRFSDEENEAHVGMEFRKYIGIWLPRVVISWDIVDDDGHAVPVTAEAIEQHEIPDSLLLAFHTRILNSDLSGKANSSNSPVR